MSPKIWWYVARSGGMVSWALLTASVVWGLFVSTRSLSKRPGRGWVLDLHRHLGGLAVVFTAVHVTGLVADSYVHFGVADVLVPMATDWHPLAVSYGIVSVYLLLAVEVTALLQRRLPRTLWRRVHLLSFPLYVLGTVHLFTAGTDARSPIVRWLAVGSALVVVQLTAFRLMLPRKKAHPRRPATRPGRQVPAATPTPEL